MCMGLYLKYRQFVFFPLFSSRRTPITVLFIYVHTTHTWSRILCSVRTFILAYSYVTPLQPGYFRVKPCPELLFLLLFVFVVRLAWPLHSQCFILFLKWESGCLIGLYFQWFPGLFYSLRIYPRDHSIFIWVEMVFRHFLLMPGIFSGRPLFISLSLSFFHWRHPFWWQLRPDQQPISSWN